MQRFIEYVQANDFDPSESVSAPLSVEQEQLFGSMSRYPAGTFNVLVPFQFEWSDPEEGARSLARRLARHRVLAATVDLSGAPVQRVEANDTIPCLPLPDTDQPWRMSEAAELPKDLLAADRLAAVVWGPGDRTSTFVALVVSHLVHDPETLSLLRAEVLGGGSERAPGLQYLQFATWQRDVLLPAIARSHYAYFDDIARNVKPILFPTERHPSLCSDDLRSVSRAGEDFVVELPQPVATRLRDIARLERISLFAAVMATVQIVISRRSGLTDFVLNFVLGARIEPGTSSMVGNFARMMAFTAQVPNGSSGKSVRASTWTQLLDLFRHGLIPNTFVPASCADASGGTAVVAGSNIPASLGPAFADGIRMTVQLFAGHQSQIGGHSQLASATSRTGHLSWWFISNDASMRCRIRYATDLFTEDDIRRLVSDFCSVVTEED